MAPLILLRSPPPARPQNLTVDEANRTLRLGKVVLREGDWISLNGETGEIILGKQPLRTPALSGDLARFMTWVDKHRRLKIYSNADTAEDAEAARRNGAEGIGLVRPLGTSPLPWMARCRHSWPFVCVCTCEYVFESERLPGAAGTNGDHDLPVRGAAPRLPPDDPRLLLRAAAEGAGGSARPHPQGPREDLPVRRRRLQMPQPLDEPRARQRGGGSKT